MGEFLNNKRQRDLEDLRKEVDELWSDCCGLQEQLKESETENNALKDKIKQLSEQIEIDNAYIKKLENENAKLSAPTQNKHDAIATPEHDFESVRRLQTPLSVLISQGKTMKDRNTEADWLEQSSTDELIKWIIRDQNDMRKKLETTKEHLGNQESLNTQLAQENECLKKKLDTLHDATSESPPLSVGTGKHQSLMDEAGKLSDSDEGSIIIGEYNPIVAAHPKPIVDIAPSPIKPATHRTGSEEILGIAPKQGTTINTSIKSLLSACHIVPATSNLMKEGLETIKAHLKEQENLDTRLIGELRELDQQKKLFEERSAILHSNITNLHWAINIEDPQKSHETHERQATQDLASARNATASESQFAKVTLMTISKEHSAPNETGYLNALYEGIPMSEYWLKS